MKNRPVKRLTDKQIFEHTINSAEIEGIFLKEEDKKRIMDALVDPE